MYVNIYELVIKYLKVIIYNYCRYDTMKVRTTISIDRELLARAKEEEGFNLSGVCERAVAEALGMKKVSKYEQL